MMRRKRPRAAAQALPYTGKISDAQIGVRRESRAELLAERKRPLIADHAIAGAAIAVAGRQDQTKTRRESRLELPFFQRLVTIIEQRIADTVNAVWLFDQMARQNRI